VTIPSPTSAESALAPAAPTSASKIDLEYLAMAIRTAARNVAAGGGPFAAMIVHEGLILGIGTNEVTKRLDPTAHAEVVAIRAACRRLHRVCLADCVLYSSCEPCPLCVAVSAWARLSRVVYAADRHDAMAAGCDDETFYEELGRAAAAPQIPVQRAFAVSAQEPFEAWRRRQQASAR
jgi:guanine deaminase